MARTPDLVILNGRLITFDPARPRASALAVAGGRIVAVGDTAEIRAMAGPGTRVFDAAGGTVLPGFIDSHVHLFPGSVELDCLNIHGVGDEGALTARVRARAAERPHDALILAVQADYTVLGPGRATTRQDLDRVLPDRPLALWAPDHHTLWANTAALRQAGILRGGAVDAGCEIVMAPDGTATGELREFGAFAPVLALSPNGGRDGAGLTTGANPVPAPTAAERAADKAALRRGLAHCARQGITGLHNFDGNLYQMELLAEIDAEDGLACRIEVPLHLKSFDPLARLHEVAEMRKIASTDRLWCNRVKIFMDGVVESRTALMLEPYPGTDHIGDAVWEAAPFAEACIRADAMGLQISVHAIGDLAIRRTLDGFEAARRANGARDSRHRIEHIEVLHPDDLPRFAALGVVASIQPRHAPFGGYFPPEGAGRMLHPRQIPTAYAWQAIRRSGARVIFSTDWPVIPVDVMPTIQAAVAPLPMPAPWTDQRQTLIDTLESYTAGNAWVEFNEARKGRLAPGMMADVAVLSHDLEALDPAHLTEASAVLTVCDGRVTWQG